MLENKDKNMDKLTIKTIVDNANSEAAKTHEYNVKQKMENIKYHQQNIENERKNFESRVSTYGKEIAKTKSELLALKAPVPVTAEDLFGADVVAAAV